eukprot:gene5738-1023_t
MTFVAARDAIHNQTAVIISVYIPRSVDQAVTKALLDDNIESVLSSGLPGSRLYLSVDGSDNGASVTQELATKHQVQTVIADVNGGKLAAIRNAATVALKDQAVCYVALIDQDGDHFGNELANMMRQCLHTQGHAGTNNVLVLGSRTTLHHPMGFLRGELEAFADRLLLDSLGYMFCAIREQPLNLQYTTNIDEVPDFHSGYKVLTRPAAVAALTRTPNKCNQTDQCYFHHNVESVMVVESLMSGATLACCRRSTMNEQPVSTFGLMNRSQLVSSKIIWPARRLGVPPEFVKQWLQNHVPRLLLTTLSPDGTNEVTETRTPCAAQIVKMVGDNMGFQVQEESLSGALFL